MNESHALPLNPVSSGCGCAEHDHADPVLDARTIPHAIRHGAIFGALDSLGAGQSMVLVAPHDPLPLLDQARQRYSDELTVEYVQSGPDAWHLRMTR
jgi:uncharacterized protein (DUF2249 family)